MNSNASLEHGIGDVNNGLLEGEYGTTVIKLKSSSIIDINALDQEDHLCHNEVQPSPRCNSRQTEKMEGREMSEWKIRFRQQQMEAWHPALNPSTVWKYLYITGSIIVALGLIMLFCDTMDAHEVVVPYTTQPSCEDLRKRIQDRIGKVCSEKCAHVSNESCTADFLVPFDMYAPVYVYYDVLNFHQNHRKYTKSRDDRQLLGKIYEDKEPIVPYECSPSQLHDRDGKIFYPCGSLASSMFSDVFTLKNPTGSEIEMSKTNIYFSDLKHLKYSQPSDLENLDEKMYNKNKSTGGNFVQTFTWPQHWSQTLWKEWFQGGGVYNPAFINWMQPSHSANVRKLYGIVVGDVPGCRKAGVLCKGNYSVKILYRYDVDSFNGEKQFVLATTSYFGLQNSNRSSCTIGIGVIIIVCSTALFILHRCGSYYKIIPLLCRDKLEQICYSN